MSNILYRKNLQNPRYMKLLSFFFKCFLCFTRFEIIHWIHCHSDNIETLPKSVNDSGSIGAIKQTLESPQVNLSTFFLKNKKQKTTKFEFNNALLHKVYEWSIS